VAIRGSGNIRQGTGPPSVFEAEQRHKKRRVDRPSGNGHAGCPRRSWPNSWYHHRNRSAETPGAVQKKETDLPRAAPAARRGRDTSAADNGRGQGGVGPPAISGTARGAKGHGHQPGRNAPGGRNGRDRFGGGGAAASVGTRVGAARVVDSFGVGDFFFMGFQWVTSPFVEGPRAPVAEVVAATVPSSEKTGRKWGAWTGWDYLRNEFCKFRIPTRLYIQTGNPNPGGIRSVETRSL